METVGSNSQSEPQGAELLVALYKTTRNIQYFDTEKNFNICIQCIIISFFYFFFKL